MVVPEQGGKTVTWKDLATHDLVVYTTTWCPDCRRIKDVFGRNSVPYKELDIDADAEAAKRLQQRTGRTAIPYVEIDGDHIIRGWHEEKPGRWNDDVFLAEAAGALSGE